MDYTSPKAISAKSVVDSGRFELADFLDKLDVLWLQGDMSKEEREALTEEARERADPAQSYAPMEKRIEALELSIAELKATVEANARGMAAMKEAIEKLGEQVVVPEPEPGPADKWPDYVQPTGAHDAYHVGDKITWGGKRWTCKMDGCVWDPGAYPAGWEYAGDAPAEDGEE